MLVATLAAVLPAAALAQVPALDQQAREAAWSGRIGDGLALMGRHLSEHPGDRAAQLDRVRFLAWRGDTAGAIEALDALGEDDHDARALRARIHAWAGRRDAALALNGPLLGAEPANPDLAYTQAVALRRGAWPHEALAPLTTVESARPEAPDTRGLARSVRQALFSSVGVPWSVYEDSDDIRIESLGVEMALRLADRWTLLADAVAREHSAPAAGPFAPVGGGARLDERRAGLGVIHAFSPDATLQAWVGRSSIDAPDEEETIGRISYGQRLGDDLDIGLRVDRDRIAASPRSVSLGVMQTGVSLDVQWRPTLRDAVQARAGWGDLTADNRRLGVDVDYRHAIARLDKVNVDVGGQAEWFGYSRDPGQGYYSPDRYVRVAPLVSAYFKLGEEQGLQLQAVAGVQRDDEFTSWKRALDVSGELTLGIFTHWQLVARAAYSERFNEFGQYDGASVGLALRYRFCEFLQDRCPWSGRP
ncbi:hypothetical protein GCM10028795_09400 [Lysobacter olei]